MDIERPIVFVDLETTGTNTSTDRIVEISICKLHPNEDREIKTRRVNPDYPIPVSASEVHGIKYEDVKDEPVFKLLAKGIYEFISGCDFAGFNSNRFDVPLLFAEFERSGIVWDYSDVNFIDVGTIFVRCEPRTLSAAAKFYLGRDIENAHSAEADITATVDVFFAQIEKYPDLPKTVTEMATYSNYDKPILDLSGWFAHDESGAIIFAKGKNKGLRAIDNRDYVDWMRYKCVNPPMPTDVKNICDKILKR